MASRDESERHLLGVVSGALRRWLDRARDAVMKPWRDYGMQPQPASIFTTQQQWNGEVDAILTELGKISMGAWSQATDVPPVSRHAFVMSQLAQTQNFLVRIPDEVYNQIFAVITDEVNRGSDLRTIAGRVDNTLTWTGSENWPGRARTIAVTENTRAYGAGTLAAGVEQSRVTGKILRKQWKTEADPRVRSSHRAVNNQIIPLMYPFVVGGEYILFPGDPMGSPEEVINCRCDLVIVD